MQERVELENSFQTSPFDYDRLSDEIKASIKRHHPNPPEMVDGMTVVMVKPVQMNGFILYTQIEYEWGEWSDDESAPELLLHSVDLSGPEQFVKLSTPAWVFADEIGSLFTTICTLGEAYDYLSRFVERQANLMSLSQQSRMATTPTAS